MSAGVIKSVEAVELSAVLAPLELRDVHAETEALIDAARREAEEIRRNAAVDTRARVAEAMQAAQKAGHEAGYRAGLEAGRKAGQAEGLAEARHVFSEGAKSALAALNEVNRQWREHHRTWFVESRQEVVGLSIAIARRIARRVPEIDEGTAADSCRAALEALGGAHELTVRAHPGDMDLLRKLAPQMSDLLPQEGSIRWVSDESVGRGGVRLQSPSGSVDASLGKQIQRVADELLDGWRQRMACQGPEAAGHDRESEPT